MDTYALFDQALYPVECTNWCIYALFINDKDRIRRDCFLKKLNQTTNLEYSLDGDLWVVSALAAEKLQIQCVMETHVITIKPPLQIMDVGNGCEAYSASIYIPAKSELTATLQSITRSQFFLDYNFNYTNVSNFLVWYKLDFAKLTNEEIKTLKAKVLKLPTMSMEMFNNILENIDENYPFSLSPTLNSLLPILSKLASSKIKTMITPTTVSTLPQTTLDELILPLVIVPRLQVATSPSSTEPVQLNPRPVYPNQKSKQILQDVTTEPISLEMFNKAASDLNTKGVINLKKFNHYLVKKTSKPT